MSFTCAECGHANRDEARFCAECGAELARACAACGATLSPAARFCNACGVAVGPLGESGAVRGLESRKVLTVVFADLAGSTALQESLDAESARRVMNRFYEQMRAVLEAHGGVVEKFIGDAVVALFGRRAVREDDAVRAVRAAAAMVVELESLNGELERSWGVRLRMRTGVNTGELVVSDTGALVGDMMNTAARLEQAAAEGEVLVGEATWRLVRQAVELVEVAPLRVKGKSHALRAWRVASAPAADRRRTAAVETPLIGRVSELARLRVALDEVLAARACRLVSVVGSPGVGKSRLAREFAAAVADRAAVVEGHCEPTGEGITLLPVAEILRAVAGIGEADPVELVREKLAALVPEDDPDRERLVERSAGVLGVVEPASAQETFWALRRGVEFLARERPLVLVLDDLHWAQPLLLDLVEHLVEWVRDAPVLLVALARPELREAREALLSGRRAADVIELKPLDERESLELVDGLLGEVPVPAGLRARILDVTEGNPLFLGETLRMLVDEGALQREGDVWVPAEGLDAVEVPPTIQALLAARIERLGANERSVVERASVIGKQFYRGAVAELVAPPVAFGIDAHLEALRRKDMVEPEGTYWIDEPVYRFHHVLIRDAAYRSLLKEARSELHERFADWLQDKAGELVGEHEEVIAFHLEQAHEYRRELAPLDDRGRALGLRAAERLWSAGRRALAREDLAAAANLLSRALARDAGEEARLLWDLCDAVLSAGDTAAAGPLVDRYADASGDGRTGPARAQVLRGQLANLTGAPDVSATALALTDAAATLAEQGDREGEARAHQVAAGAYARLGQVGAVEAALDRALAAARGAGDRRRTTAVLAAAPRAALWGPSPVVRASGRCLDVVRILRMTPGNRHVEAIALRCQAVLEAMRGRVEAAREILAACRTTLEELGLAFELNETGVHAGIVELLAAEPAAACEHLRAARAGFEALGAGAGAAQAAALLARALVAVGDDASLAEAITHSEFAEAHSGEDLTTVIIWTSARAQALARFGDVDRALSLAQRATALAEPTDALADKGDAAVALADVLLAAGQPEEATAVAKSAAGFYEAKGHTVGAEGSRQVADTAGPRTTTAAPRPAAPSQASAARAVLADRPPERYWREFNRRFDAHDLDGLLELMDEGRVLTDHRKLGWAAADGIEQTRDGLEAAFSVSPDVRIERDEVLACDERVIAMVLRYAGHGADGSGEFETAIGSVTVIEDGRLVRADRYEPDDRRAMIARYAELGGGVAALDDRPPERWWREHARRYAAREIDELVDLFAEECEFVEHRNRGWPSGSGRHGVTRNVETVWDGSTDVRVEVDEVLACEDRMIALRLTMRGTAKPAGGSGSWAYPLGAVTVVQDGRCVRLEYFNDGDRDAMLARFGELSGDRAVPGVRPPERHVREWTRRWKAGDLDEVLAMHAHDWVLRDHRGVRTMEEQHGLDEARRLFESLRALSPDIRLEIDEVLACDDRVIAYRHAWRGTAADGGGSFEAAAGFVTLIEDGVERSVDQFDSDDRAGMIARYVELGGGLGPLGERPPERWFKRLATIQAAKDRVRLPGLYAEDYRFNDHRLVGWEPTASRREAAQRIESIWEGTTDVHLEVHEVLACDSRALALRLTWEGGVDAALGGGRFAFPLCAVVLLDGEEAKCWDQYEPEDRDAAISRFVELTEGGHQRERPRSERMGGGPGPLGDRAPERHLADVVRAWARRDPEALLALQEPDFVRRDHRALGMEELRGRDAIRRAIESVLAVSPDLRFEVDEVLACDGRVIAARVAWRGAARDGGGVAESAVGIVDVVQDGLTVSRDQYDYDDTAAMRARFAELTEEAEGPAEPTATGHRDWLAGHDEWLAGDGSHRVAELIDPEAVVRDRRGFPATDRSGVEAYRELVGPGTATELIDSQGDFVLARREDDAPLYLVGEIRDGRLVEAIGLRDDERAREWLAALVTWREFEQAARAGDMDGLLAHHPPDGTIVDHRPLRFQDAGSRQDLHDIYAGLGQLLTRTSASAEVLEVYPGATVVSLRWSGSHRDSGGPVEWLTFHASMVRDGLYVETHTYADADSALAKLEELSPMAAGTRIAREYVEAINAEDFDALRALYTEDCVLVDHRTLVGWQDVDSSAGLVASYQSWKQKQLGEVTVRAEILVDAGGPFFRQVFSGAWQGGTWEIATDTLNTLRDGRISRVETFDLEQADARRARAAELRGNRGGMSRRPDQPPQRAPERYYQEWIRRWTARDLEGLVELYDENWSLREHRAANPNADYRGRKALRAQFDSILALSEDARFAVEEILACDERVIVARISWRGTAVDGGGEIEVPIGFVTLIEDGREMSLDQFDADDRPGMIARYAELGGGQTALGDRPPERFWAEFCRRWATLDPDATAELYAEDWTATEHRPLGWSDMHGREAAREHVRSTTRIASTFRFEIGEVLACDDRVIALALRVVGTSSDSGGPFEFAYGCVCVIEDGVMTRLERFDADDRDRMTARFQELRGGSS